MRSRSAAISTSVAFTSLGSALSSPSLTRTACAATIGVSDGGLTSLIHTTSFSFQEKEL